MRTETKKDDDHCNGKKINQVRGIGIYKEKKILSRVMFVKLQIIYFPKKNQGQIEKKQ